MGGGSWGTRRGGGGLAVSAPPSRSQEQLCSSAPAHSLQERRRWAAQPLARDAVDAVVNSTQSQHTTSQHTAPE